MLTRSGASVGGEAGSVEQWTSPAGKTLFGVSRTVRNSETVAHEFLQIRETETGEIEYIAKPSGQTEATFLMVRLSEGLGGHFKTGQWWSPQKRPMGMARDSVVLPL